MSLTDDDRALLRALARDRLAGQRVGFRIGLHVVVPRLAALLFGLRKVCAMRLEMC